LQGAVKGVAAPQLNKGMGKNLGKIGCFHGLDADAKPP
jgi:hypothetical protein